MNTTKQPKTFRARLATAIIAAIIGAVATIVAAGIGYGVAVYQQRHNDADIRAGYTHKLEFKASSSTKSQAFELKPCSGNLYVSAMQTSGKTDSNKPTYKFYSKKSSSSSYSYGAQFKPSNNNVFSKEYELQSVSSGTKYNLLVKKTAGYKYKSKLEIDWIVK